MQMLAGKKSILFGSEELSPIPNPSNPKQNSRFWESERRISDIQHPNFGKSAFSIILSTNPEGELLEAKISDRVEQFTVKFDCYGKLVEDSYPPERKAQVKNYEQQLLDFLHSVGVVLKSSNSEELRQILKSLAMQKHRYATDYKLETAEPFFSRVVKVQENDENKIEVHIPAKVAEKMKLERGKQVEWIVTKQGLVLKMLEDAPCLVRIEENKEGERTIVLPHQMAEKMQLRVGMTVQWSTDKSGSPFLKPAEEELPHTVKIRSNKGYLFMTLPMDIAKELRLNGGMQAEWIPRGEELVLEPKNKMRFILKLHTNPENKFSAVIPKDIARPMDLSGGMEAEWTMDGKGNSLLRLR